MKRLIIICLLVVLTFSGCLGGHGRVGDMNPHLSPDGTKIKFSSTSPEAGQILEVMNIDGSNRISVTDNSTFLDWSLDSSQIFVRLYSKPGVWEIRAVRVDGSGFTTITTKELSLYEPSGARPILSPDGTSITYSVVNRSSKGFSHWEVRVVMVDGSGEINLSDISASDTDPVWSPDGSKICFRSHLRIEGQYEYVGWWDIIVANPDGTDRKNLTNSLDFDVGDHIWSPDGSKIYFIGRVQEEDSIVERLFVMNADGSDQMSLADDYSPGSWSLSPDGTSIAFQTGGYAGNPRTEIFVMNADGSNIVKLVDGTQPIWSPDGSRILFKSGESNKNEICVIRADGTGHITLNTITGMVKYGSPFGLWSPDGNKIVFNYGQLEEHKLEPDYIFDIYIIDAGGGESTLLTGEPKSGATQIIWIVVPIVVVMVIIWLLIRYRRRRLSQQEPHIVNSK